MKTLETALKHIGVVGKFVSHFGNKGHKFWDLIFRQEKCCGKRTNLAF